MASDYITWLRSRIGHRKTLLVCATALMRDDNGRVLLQRRADFKDAWWGLPGGVLEIGETFTDCAKREAFEETGYHVEPLRMIGLYASPEFDVRYPNGDEVQQFTLALECRIVDGHPATAESEIIDQHFFDLNELPDCPAWYAAMLRDLDACSDPYFDPPIIGDPQDSYVMELRKAVGPARLIVAGAGALIFDDRRRILLGLRSDNYLWGMPAGQMELGETPAGTVVRETYEELGLHIRPTQLAGVYSGSGSFHTYPDGNQIQVAGARFLADIVDGELRPDGVETLDARWFDLDQLPPMPPRHQYAVEEALEHPERGRFL